MGQQMSSDCANCQGNTATFFNMCIPEDPSKEEQNTFSTPSPVPGYPVDVFSEQGPSMNLKMAQGGSGFAFTNEEMAFVAAPPPNSDRGPQVELRASNEPVAVSRSNSVGRQNSVEVTADDILSNLEGSEEVMYGEAFAKFPGGQNGAVGLDCAPMRDFLCTNSAVSMEDIDMELLKVAAPEEGLSHYGFMQLLRDFSVSDGDSIMHFMGLSNDGESLSCEDCRSALLLFAQQKLTTNFSDDRWECIFNTVMWDAGMSVTMEQFLGYCKLTGRIVRLMRYSQVKKLAMGSRTTSGVRGGA